MDPMATSPYNIKTFPKQHFDICNDLLHFNYLVRQAFEFPDNVGFPLGSAGDPTFFVMETHYDNPALRTGEMLIYY